MQGALLNAIMASCFVFATSFILGSVPWGLIISKYAYHTDIREHGSGNIGTTNAMRTMGKAGGIAVFLLDFGKGVCAALIALGVDELCRGQLGMGSDAPQLALLLGVSFFGCVWGHIFSPWLGFKGGKGIAVAIGNLFITFGILGACIEIVVFAVLVIVTRYVSVGSIASAVVCPFLAAYYCLYANHSVAAWVFVSVGALTVIWAHRGNIERLRAGTERKVGH